MKFIGYLGSNLKGQEKIEHARGWVRLGLCVHDGSTVKIGTLSYPFNFLKAYAYDHFESRQLAI